MDKNEIVAALQGVSLRSSSWLLTNESVEEARHRILKSEDTRALLKEIRTEANLLLKQATPELRYSVFRLFEATGSRQEYEQLYFLRRKRLTVFGLLSWLEPDNKPYEEALCDMLWSVCDEYTWCLPAHYQGERTIDLFAAETAFALGEILALTGDRLPRLVRERVRQQIHRRVLEPFLQEGPWEWETARHNWASVCSGSIGAAAIYLLADTDQLAAVLERVIAAMQCYLQGFEMDGVCAEGYLYWQYGFGFFVYFADLLNKRTAGRINLLANEKVGEIARFQQKSFLHGRKVVNFSDSLPESGVFMGLSYYLKGLYQGVDLPEASLRAAFNEDHCSRWAPALRNLLWLGDTQGKPWSEASYYMKPTQWFISRIAATQGRFGFAAKGGHNDEPHNHNDIGHFILNGNGVSLLPDLGSGQYTREYFGEGRYDILCNGSQGHSVPMINGCCQRAGREAQAVVQEASIGAQEDRFAIEMSSAYALDELQELTRTFVWDKEQAQLELQDHFTFTAKPECITERFIVANRPREVDEGRVVVEVDQALLLIAYDHQQLSCSVEPLLHRDHFGREVYYYAVDFTVKAPSRGEAVRFTFTCASKE